MVRGLAVIKKFYARIKTMTEYENRRDFEDLNDGSDPNQITSLVHYL